MQILKLLTTKKFSTLYAKVDGENANFELSIWCLLFLWHGLT